MDWNNDGKKDLITGECYGYVRVYLNVSTGAVPSLTNHTYVAVGGSTYSAGSYSAPCVVDWNNDGKKDIVCGRGDGNVSLLLNAGTDAAPLFSVENYVQNGAVPLSVGFWSAPVVVDWNEDGKKDLLVGNEDGTLRFYRNIGTDASPVFNGYTNLTAGTSIIDLSYYSHPNVADWNKDGERDVVMGDYNGNVKVFLSCPRVKVQVPDAATEGDGVLAGQGALRLALPAASNLIVSLQSDNTIDVTVPASVTVLAGQTNVPFDVTIQDDSYLDGSQMALITCSAPGYSNDTAAIVVHDNETATLGVQLPASAKEGNGVLVGQGIVTSSQPTDRPVAISLTSSDTTEATVPATVTLSAGQTNASFNITIVNDTEIDGPQSVYISAYVQNWTGASNKMTVTDNENTNLTVTLPAWMGEGMGVVAGGGSVSISGTMTSSVVISLVSSDTSELMVTSTVTIAAGQTSTPFDPLVVDDALADGIQPVTITATASRFAKGEKAGRVFDNEVNRLTMSAIASPQVVTVPFALTVAALDINGSNSAYSGSVSLNATGDGGASPVAPVSGVFSQGVFSNGVSINGLDTNVRLKATDGSGHSVTSAPFNVVAGPAHHFVGQPVAPTQSVGVAFDVAWTALDANNYTVSSFAGSIGIEGWRTGGVLKTIGNATTTWDYPLYTYYHDARTQVIYPASYLAWTGLISSLALDVTALPGQGMTNWTIRMKHTSLTNYPASPQWEGSGWTSVYQKNETIASTGWVTFVFSTPFRYDGTNSLMIDFSFNNNSWTASGVTRGTTPGGVRSLYYYTDSGYGDPLTWAGSSSPVPYTSTIVPDIRLSCGIPVSVTPVSSGTFTGGSWTGGVAVLDETSGVLLFGGGSFVNGPLTVVCDRDGDGIEDCWECRYGGMGQLGGDGADFDDDGMTDVEEFLAGTNPTNGQSLLCVENLAKGFSSNRFVITWQSVTGRTYNVQYAPGLTPPSWSNANPSPIPAAIGGETRYTATVNSAESLFFRVELP